MDNFYYGTADIMKLSGLNLIKEIGSFDNRCITEKGDYRNTIEPQFREFIKKYAKIYGVALNIANIRIGIKVYSESQVISIPIWKVFMDSHPQFVFDKNLTPRSYNLPGKYRGVNEMYPLVWTYYIF
jgi:hypothetical protein